MPPNSDNFLAATLGYFSHIDGPRYFSPLHSTVPYPDLVELHESQHQYLALANTTDAIVQLYVLMLQHGDAHLDPEHKRQIRRFLATISRHSLLVHETVATYLSFLFFAARHRDNVLAARSTLPRDYGEFLLLGERCFGQVLDSRTIAALGRIPTTVYSSAIAALSLPFLGEHLALSSLEMGIRYVESNSPNKRFRRILKRLRPHWDPAGLLSSIVNSQSEPPLDYDAYQVRLFACFRSVFPAIEFISARDHPTYFRDLAKLFISSVEAAGYSFMDGFEVAPHPGDSVFETTGAQYTVPGWPSEYPLDLSLTGKYQEESLEFLIKALDHNLSAICLCVHVIPANESKSADLFLFGYWISPDSNVVPTNIPAIRVQSSLDAFLTVLNTTANRNIIIKIDSRLPRGIRELFRNSGHMILVLMHDTRPAQILRAIDINQDQKEIFVFRVRFPGAGDYSALIVTQDCRMAYVAPLTEVARDVVTHGLGHERLHSLDPASLFPRLGDLAPFFLRAVVECYTGRLRVS